MTFDTANSAFVGDATLFLYCLLAFIGWHSIPEASKTKWLPHKFLTFFLITGLFIFGGVYLLWRDLPLPNSDAPKQAPPSIVTPPVTPSPALPAPLSPATWQSQGLTTSNKNVLPIAIRAEEQSVPGHYLDSPTATALFELLKAENFNVVNETTSSIDESKIGLFIDIDVAAEPIAPSPPLTCDGGPTTSVENINVQFSATWNSGDTLYSPTQFSGAGFGCPDQAGYMSNAETGAEMDAAKKINSQILSLVTSK